VARTTQTAIASNWGLRAMMCRTFSALLGAVMLMGLTASAVASDLWILYQSAIVRSAACAVSVCKAGFSGAATE
jgi:hypothetical protein